MTNVADLAIVSLDTITAYGMDGGLRFILDELQNATIANSEEKVDITGKAGRKLNSLKRNKAVTISGTNGLVSAGLMEGQTGSQFAAATDAVVKYHETLYIKDDAATMTYEATGTAGAEIDALYVKDADKVAGTLLTQADEAGAGKFTYETKALKFAADAYPDGTEIVVYYSRKVTGNVLKNLSDSYSEKLRLYIDVTAEDKCSNQYHAQIEIPRADFSGNFELAMGGDQTVHAFEAEALAGSCGGNGELWSYTVFGVTTA